jgi:hypothetical protein
MVKLRLTVYIERIVKWDIDTKYMRGDTAYET